MSKFRRISLERRGVSCVAELLEKDAPRTCAAVFVMAQACHDVWRSGSVGERLVYERLSDRDAG